MYISARQEKQVITNPRVLKRQLNSDDDDDYDDDDYAKLQAKRAQTTKSILEPAPLTRENLAKLNKMRGNSRRSTNRGSSRASVSRISASVSGFDIQAVTNGILDPANSRPPRNLEELRQRSARLRGSPSPSESDYRNYVIDVNQASNEATMLVETVGLLKRHRDNGYNRAIDQPFTAFPLDEGFNNGMSAPQPGFVEGPTMRAYLPFRVDEHIPGAVLYKDDRYAVTLPHIAGEWKSRNGNMTTARLQSAYAGASLVYGRNQALSYLGKSDPPGHASIITFTTNGSELNTYAHYADTADNGDSEYHQYYIDSVNMVASYERHKAGRRMLRNLQDDAKMASEALKDVLKKAYDMHWRNLGAYVHPDAEDGPSRGRDHDEDVGSANTSTRNGGSKRRASSSPRGASRYRRH